MIVMEALQKREREIKVPRTLHEWEQAGWGKGHGCPSPSTFTPHAPHLLRPEVDQVEALDVGPGRKHCLCVVALLRACRVRWEAVRKTVHFPPTHSPTPPPPPPPYFTQVAYAWIEVVVRPSTSASICNPQGPSQPVRPTCTPSSAPVVKFESCMNLPAEEAREN